MSPKHLIILVVVCAVLGGVGLLVTQKDKASAKAQTAKAGQKVLAGLDVNAVTAVTISNGEAVCTIRKGEERWQVEQAADYAANFETVRGLLTKLMDLKSAQIVQVGEADYGRLELNAPGSDDGATKIVLLGDGDSEIATLLLGKEHMSKAPANSPFGGGFPNGRYVTVPGSGSVALVSETFGEVDVDANRWIDKSFVKVDKIRSGEARSKAGTIWTVMREQESADLTLVGDVPAGKEVDSAKLTGIDSTLRFPNFSSIGGRADSQDWGFGGDDARVFVADTFDGRTWSVKIGKANDAKEYPVQLKLSYKPLPFPAGPEGESEEAKAERQKAHDEQVATIRKEVEEAQARYDGWVYLVASYTVDDLLYDRDALLKDEEKEGDKAATPAAGGGQPPLPFLQPPSQ